MTSEDPKTWKSVSDNLVLHIPSQTYYARKYRKGKGRFFKTTGETRKGLAQSKANEMIAEWLFGKKPLGKYALVSEVCEKLQEDLQKEFENGDRSEKTWEHDRVYLKQVKNFFGELFINEIDEEFWRTWVRNDGRKLNRTLGDLAKYLSKTLTFAHAQKLIDRKPKILNPDNKPGEKPVYEFKSIRKLMDVIDPNLKDIVIIAAECGMRPYEVRKLEWSMVQFSKTVVIQLPDWRVKTRKSREFMAGPMSSEALRKRYKKRTSAFVFPSHSDLKKPINEMTFSRKWRKAVEAAGLPKGSKFHWLRHTFFTHALLKAGKELPKVAAYGGNSPKILFDEYMSKQASRTSDVAGVLKLDEEE